MASISNQQPDIVLFCESYASNGIRVSSDINRILRIAPNTTFPTALVRDRIAAVVREICLHYARRALLVQRWRMPCLLDSCAGRGIIGRQVVLLSDNVEGAMVAGRADGNVRDEAPTNCFVQRVPGPLGWPVRVARYKATSACYGRSWFVYSGGFDCWAAGSEEKEGERGEHEPSKF